MRRKWQKLTLVMMVLFFLGGCAALFQNPGQSIPMVFDEVAFHLDIAREVMITLEADGTLSPEKVAKYKPIYNEAVKAFKSSGELVVSMLESKDPVKTADFRTAYRNSIITAVRAFTTWKSDKPDKEMLVVKIAMAEGLKLLKQLPYDFNPADLTEAEKAHVLAMVKSSLEMVKPWE